MIYTSLPTGNHGWGVAGDAIRRELARTQHTQDVSSCSVATEYDAPLLMASRGSDFVPMNLNPRAPRTVGYGFIEDIAAAKTNKDNCSRYYDAFVSGSTWMRDQLRGIGIDSTVAIQGVDYDLFKVRATPPNGVGGDIEGKRPFTICVGGKFEFRKGQDIALAAFHEFKRRHLDTRLVAHWRNPWTDSMKSMEQSRWINYDHSRQSYWLDEAARYREDNDGWVKVQSEGREYKHGLFSEVYANCHVGLFPNRCEAGTNLVMCEAIACGLPVIASHATGHKDITSKVPCYRLEDGICGDDGWWNPTSLDEILEHLEYAYYHRREIREIGLCGAETIRLVCSWEKCTKQLLDVLEAA